MTEPEQSNTFYEVPTTESLQKLSDTTKILLRLVEQIQSKIHSTQPIPDDPIKLSYMLEPEIQSPSTLDTNGENIQSQGISGQTGNNIDLLALQRLGLHTKHLDSIKIESEDNDCSVYKRLTRKCTCLNRVEFNDFIIHFNEDIKSCTSSLGEIIKNIRIIKKFLYIGDGYARNSLLFLNEGLEKSIHCEKVDIIQACSHADICNVFESDSLVTVCILWTFHSDGTKDNTIQALASAFLYNLAQVEEGRRYLNFSTKISNDIKYILKKKSSALSEITEEQLNITLDLLNPAVPRNLNVTYYWKAEEGMGFRTLNALEMYRDLMTFEEILTHLDWLDSFSQKDKGRSELTQYLPNLLRIFKYLLVEFNNSDINNHAINILNNILGKRSKEDTGELPSSKPLFIVANVSTEPIPMKQEFIQVPSWKALGTKRDRKASGQKHRSVSRGRGNEIPVRVKLERYQGRC